MDAVKTLAFVELAACMLLMFSILFILKFQGFDTTLTWAILPFLSIIHIIGSSAQLHIEDTADAFRVNELLDTVSFVPVLLSLLCLSQRMNTLIPRSVTSTRTFLSLYILVTLATALLVIGELMFLSGADTVISLQGDLEVKAGLMLLAIALFVVIIINGFLFARGRRIKERINRLMVRCVIQSTPFLAVRLVYTFISRYQPSLVFMSINGYVVSRAFAVVLMELISVGLHLFVGYLDRPEQDGLPPLKGSHTVERDKGFEIQIVIYEAM